jgi:hypothetical protein
LVATVAAAAMLLAACTAWSGAGAVGGAAGGLLVLVFLFFAGTAQTGCIEDKPDPDPDEDAMVGPCLSDADLTPCLSQMRDADVDAIIGPCLSRIEPDLGVCLGPLPSEPEPDVGFEGCLTAPDAFIEPDARLGPCLGPPIEDAGLDGPEPDFPLGPCLDTPPDDVDGSALLDHDGPAYAAAQRSDTRGRILDRLIDEGRLPDDVAARLKQKS